MSVPETENFKSIPDDHPFKGIFAPLFAGHNKIRERMEGTAFLIAPQLALTAKHVIAEYLERIQNFNVEEHSKPGVRHEGKLSFTMFMPLLTKDGQNIPLIVERSYFCGFGDIALLRLRLGDKKYSWRDLAPYPTLNMIPPKVGNKIFSLGFPNSSTVRNKENIVELHTWPRISSGVVKEVHKIRRDPSLINYPCFQVNSRLDGGMSGGPVINEEGSICGIISKSFDLIDGEEPIGYAASLWPSGMIPMPDLPRKKNDSLRLIDLYRRRRVTVNDLYNVRDGFGRDGKFVIQANPDA